MEGAAGIDGVNSLFNCLLLDIVLSQQMKTIIILPVSMIIVSIQPLPVTQQCTDSTCLSCDSVPQIQLCCRKFTSKFKGQGIHRRLSPQVLKKKKPQKLLILINSLHPRFMCLVTIVCLTFTCTHNDQKNGCDRELPTFFSTDILK